jgi:CheY-like chemotaxis protein
MVTAYGREEVLRQAEDTGFESVLIKPVTSSILFDAVIGALGGSVDGKEAVQAAPSFELDRIRGTRILLVEDNEINREVALGQLEDAEAFVDIAENGEVALRLVKANDYDAILMDMQMPVMDGIEATRAIRADPRFASLPIIAMTANAMASDRELCLEAGMNDHIAKPIDPDQLFGVLLRWIQRGGDGETMHAPILAPAQPMPAAVIDIEIPGVDVRSGLRRTGSNVKRYKTLLSRFAQQEGGAVDTMRTALAMGDAATAERAAHSLKGASGTLGAFALSSIAAEAETAIKLGQRADQALATLAVTLARVVDGIRNAIPETGAGGGSSPAASPATIVEPLARLKRLLENDDGEAADYMIETQDRLSRVLRPDEMKTLSERVGNFDFDSALMCLSRVAERLCLDLESK